MIYVLMCLQVGLLQAQTDKDSSKQKFTAITKKKAGNSVVVKEMRNDRVVKEVVPSEARLKKISKAYKSTPANVPEDRITLIEGQINNLNQLLLDAEAKPNQYSEAYIAKFKEALVEKQEVLKILKSNSK